MTGNKWRQLSAAEKGYYAMGVIEGWSDGSAMTIIGEKFATNPPKHSLIKRLMVPIVECLSERKMPSSQVVTITDRFLLENPEMWDKLMTDLLWHALHRACGLDKAAKEEPAKGPAEQ